MAFILWFVGHLWIDLDARSHRKCRNKPIDRRFFDAGTMHAESAVAVEPWQNQVSMHIALLSIAIHNIVCPMSFKCKMVWLCEYVRC